MMQLSCRSGIDALDVNRPSTDEIKELRSEMLEAAKKANVLGFDGVEYHFAHGFFLSRLLDSEANKRTDEFGGSLPKRASILTDIIPEIRAATGDGFIVAVRMGAYTPTEEEGIAAARHFESSGVDLLDITFGVEEPEGPVPEGFPFSPVTYSGCIIKRAVNVPVIGVFGLRSADDAKLLLEREYADIAGIGRGMLADPHFAERVIKGEPVNTCRTCRRCLWFTDHTKCPARADAR
ncbi:MAG: hypothetical protein LBS93_04230 [Synergistaceae bacterium]|jgi:2,4-dienoyl-CoA reductase-like NADH-dependent reductase (Old Yellow Enzyme family)|nr:hypothetical protein [Synergistaceae bacterium]